MSPRLTLTLIVSCFQIDNIGDVRKGVIRYDPNNGCKGDYIDVSTAVFFSTEQSIRIRIRDDTC